METVLVMMLLPGGPTSQPTAQPTRRYVVVLPLAGDDRPACEKLADNLRLKLRRHAAWLGDNSDLAVLSWVEVEEIWTGDPPPLQTEPAKMAPFIRSVGAQIGLWGELTVDRRTRAIALHLRGVDISEDPNALLIDTVFRGSGQRGHVAVTDAVAEALTGRAVRKPRVAGEVPWPKKLGPQINRNAGFEEGSPDHPTGWGRIDGLCSFVKSDPDGIRGRVLMMDTRVSQSQASAWWAQWRAGASPADAPKPKYGGGAVAGMHGVHFYSEWLEVQPGMRYRVIAEHKGPGGAPKVFVKGYALVPPTHRESEPQRREIWRTYLACRGSKGVWKRHSVCFTIPAEGIQLTRGPRRTVKWIRIIPYAYWPPGAYWWDNVRVVEEPVTPEHPAVRQPR